VEKIWELIKTKDKKSITLAHQLVKRQSWAEEEFEMYRSL